MNVSADYFALFEKLMRKAYNEARKKPQNQRSSKIKYKASWYFDEYASSSDKKKYNFQDFNSWLGRLLSYRFGKQFLDQMITFNFMIQANAGILK